MTEFKEIQLKDRELFNSYLKDSNFRTYEYAFSTLYIWRNMCRVHYSIMEDSLIIRKEEEEKGQYFMAPVGYTEDRLDEIIKQLNSIKQTSDNMPYLFRDIEEDFLSKLLNMYGEKVHYAEDEGNFDYIYDTAELISLSGKKFHSKKNHFNSFITSYSYFVKDMEEDNVGEQCIEFAKQWYENNTFKTEELKYEVEVIEDLIKNSTLLNIKGMAVYVDDVLAGFTLGEKLNKDMAVIHIEKGHNDFRGIYAFLNKVFLDKYFNDVKFVNREEDLGLKGLIKAKMSYHPINFAKKFNVNVEV